jgi:hypothetical protein
MMMKYGNIVFIDFIGIHHYQQGQLLAIPPP